MKTRAIVATAKGGPDVLQLTAIDLGWPAGPSDVLVRLHAAGVNPADCFFRQLGGYIDGPGPLVPGHDGAGVVQAAGPKVTAVKPGDHVCFCNGGIGGTPGAYAAHAVVPAAQLALIPDGISFETAAALPLVAITAWESLYERAGLKADEHVLIHGGAGGTGHIAIQLAHLHGARVATTVSSAEKAEFVRGLGADLAVDYRANDFVDAVRDWSGGGADVALDNAGAEVLQKTYRCMAPYGRIVTLMGIAPDDAELSAYNANVAVFNEMMLTPMWRGLTIRLAMQAQIVRECLALVAAGELKVHIAARFPLAGAAAAHALLERGGMFGKIVLTM